jgi:hypothetical protein
VKSHDIHNNADYADWIADTKHRYLFFAENIEKLKLFVSIIGAEKMHHAGAELKVEKLHQIGGELMRLKLQLVVGEKLNQIVAKKIICQRKNIHS